MADPILRTEVWLLLIGIHNALVYLGAGDVDGFVITLLQYIVLVGISNIGSKYLLPFVMLGHLGLTYKYLFETSNLVFKVYEELPGDFAKNFFANMNNGNAILGHFSSYMDALFKPIVLEHRKANIKMELTTYKIWNIIKDSVIVTIPAFLHVTILYAIYGGIVTRPSPTTTILIGMIYVCFILLEFPWATSGRAIIACNLNFIAATVFLCVWCADLIISADIQTSTNDLLLSSVYCCFVHTLISTRGWAIWRMIEQQKVYDVLPIATITPTDFGSLVAKEVA